MLKWNFLLRGIYYCFNKNNSCIIRDCDVMFWHLNCIVAVKRKSVIEPLDAIKHYISWSPFDINTLRPRQGGHHFPDDTFKRIFLNENVKISLKISLKFAPEGPINNIPALVQIMAWRRPGDKPLSEPMVIRLPTHICVTRPQWVNRKIIGFVQYNF